MSSSALAVWTAPPDLRTLVTGMDCALDAVDFPILEALAGVPGTPAPASSDPATGKTLEGFASYGLNVVIVP